MSDLQDLIHKTSMDCLERGKQIERERIIKLLNEAKTYGQLEYAIQLIKGGTK